MPSWARLEAQAPAAKKDFGVEAATPAMWRVQDADSDYVLFGTFHILPPDLDWRTDALNEAAVQRVRAVMLTSLTTIGGLLPLLFETSLQAQFLIPMATSIAFGLGLSTLLVLLVVPALLSWLEQFREWRARRHGEMAEPIGAPE